MGYIGVNTLFNGFILGLVLSIANSFISNKFIADNECFLVGYVISAILTIIGYTKLAGNITGLFLRGRQPIKREIDKIKPLMLDVIERANNKFQTQYKYEDFIRSTMKDLGYEMKIIKDKTYNNTEYIVKIK